MKKLIILAIISLFFSQIICSASASISVRPHEISINLDDLNVQRNTTKKITVENKNSYSFNATWYIEHPTSSKIRENKTFIHNLSFIDVEPKWMIIPANETGDFYIYTDIPKEEKYLNKNWEVWITFKKGIQKHESGFLNLEQAIRVYINTPSSLQDSNTDFQDQNEGLYSILTDDSINFQIGGGLAFLIIIIALSFTVIFYYKKKKK